MKKKVCIIGHFGACGEYLDGQTVKTKNMSAELKKQLGDDNVAEIDTHGGKKVIVQMFFKVFSALKNSENIIMMPAQNGLKFFAPVLLFWNIFFHRKLHYSVIGGWLSMLVRKDKMLGYMLKKFDCIYVETDIMKCELQQLGFCNIIVVPNFKNLNILKDDEIMFCRSKPYKLCTFSRVNRLKGIGEAVRAVKKVNELSGEIVYKLDIYGRVDEGEEEWFEELMKNAPDYVKYCGTIQSDKSVSVIKNYFALLFPTKYFTEGIPGTVIDAYAAGVPVISARWQNFDNIVDENITGIGYEFDNTEDLEQKLSDIMTDIEKFNALKVNCLNKSKQYKPDIVISRMIEKSDSKDRTE